VRTVEAGILTVALGRSDWGRWTDLWVGIALILLLAVGASVVLRSRESTGSIDSSDRPASGRMTAKIDEHRCRETTFNNETVQIIRDGIRSCRPENSSAPRSSGAELLGGVKRAINGR
jgi:hypothetical protein